MIEMPFNITSSGNFKKTEKFLKEMQDQKMYEILNSYAKMGKDALADATPSRSGNTASGWYYVVTVEKGSARIDWINNNTNKGANIAVLIQYGHGTRNGGYVEGRDYINPVMQDVFDKIADDVWKAVQSA